MLMRLFISIVFFLAKELSVSEQKQREIETLQEIITSLTLKLKDRDKAIEKLNQTLKGN